MAEIISKTGSQRVYIEFGLSGVTIMTVDVYKHSQKSVHIFPECVPEIIKQLKKYDAEHRAT